MFVRLVQRHQLIYSFLFEKHADIGQLFFVLLWQWPQAMSGCWMFRFLRFRKRYAKLWDKFRQSTLISDFYKLQNALPRNRDNGMVMRETSSSISHWNSIPIDATQWVSRMNCIRIMRDIHFSDDGINLCDTSDACNPTIWFFCLFQWIRNCEGVIRSETETQNRIFPFRHMFARNSPPRK